jgi:thioredoxin 1
MLRLFETIQKENIMKRFIAGIFLVAGFLLAVSAFAADTAPLSTPELKQMISAGKKSTIVFFLNPQGGPCKAQNEILQKLQKDRKNNFNIAYVSALDQANRKAFYDYGVRSLPTLVVVDGSGKIAKYFPPGIQTYEVLTATLDGVK